MQTKFTVVKTQTTTLDIEPQLTITLSGTKVILPWPANVAVFVLEFATNLVPPVAWQTNSTAPIVIGGQNVFINPITGSQQFFRLTQ